MPREVPVTFIYAIADVNVYGPVIRIAWQGATAEERALCRLRIQERIEVSVGITRWRRRWRCSRAASARKRIARHVGSGDYGRIMVRGTGSDRVGIAPRDAAANFKRTAIGCHAHHDRLSGLARTAAGGIKFRREHQAHCKGETP